MQKVRKMFRNFLCVLFKNRTKRFKQLIKNPSKYLLLLLNNPSYTEGVRRGNAISLHSGEGNK